MTSKNDSAKGVDIGLAGTLTGKIHQSIARIDEGRQIREALELKKILPHDNDYLDHIDTVRADLGIDKIPTSNAIFNDIGLAYQEVIRQLALGDQEFHFGRRDYLDSDINKISQKKINECKKIISDFAANAAIISGLTLGWENYMVACIASPNNVHGIEIKPAMDVFDKIIVTNATKYSLNISIYKGTTKKEFEAIWDGIAEYMKNDIVIGAENRMHDRMYKDYKNEMSYKDIAKKYYPHSFTPSLEDISLIQNIPDRKKQEAMRKSTIEQAIDRCKKIIKHKKKTRIPSKRG